jgi:hypothetical protein
MTYLVSYASRRAFLRFQADVLNGFDATVYLVSLETDGSASDQMHGHSWRYYYQLGKIMHTYVENDKVVVIVLDGGHSPCVAQCFKLDRGSVFALKQRRMWDSSLSQV